MIRALIICLVLTSCAATRSAGVRRMAESHLKFCRQERNDLEAVACYSETQAYCTRMRLEKTCGEGYQP